MDNVSIGEVIALSKAFGGGGSSGGGVMVVNGTLDDEETTCTLDKTWQEIHDGGFGVVKPQFDNGVYYYPIVTVYSGFGLYKVKAIYNGENGPDIMTFTANSASGYPSYTFE